jgi:hypothetical protein
MTTETNRTSSSGNGDSNGTSENQEENNSTKEVVIDMCNNVIMGDSKEQGKKYKYPFPSG